MTAKKKADDEILPFLVCWVLRMNPNLRAFASLAERLLFANSAVRRFFVSWVLRMNPNPRAFVSLAERMASKLQKEGLPKAGTPPMQGAFFSRYAASVQTKNAVQK
jgi:hypothetical protein